jgi:hypothetical protein
LPIIKSGWVWVAQILAMSILCDTHPEKRFKSQRPSPLSPPIGERKTMEDMDIEHAAETRRPPVRMIDPRGDVTLHCTKEGQAEVRLRVSSKVLSVASPVFTACMRPYIRGTPTRGRSYSVPLPDDDPEAMYILCNVLHFQHQRVPRTPDIPLLQELAILCDKYTCVRCVGLWPREWLSGWLRSTEVPSELEKLLAVGYTLNEPEAFAYLSLQIVRHSPTAIERTVMSDSLFEIIPEEVWSW